jgi:hypothetical protein
MAVCERYTWFFFNPRNICSLTPSIVPLRSTASEGSLSTRPCDEPLIYASVWSKRAPFIDQTQSEDPSSASNPKRSQGPTSTERLPVHSTVSTQVKPQTSVLSEAINTTHGTSPAIVSVSRKASSSSLGSQHSQRSTRSLHLSLTNTLPSLATKKEPERRNKGSVRSGKTTSEPRDRAGSRTDRIIAACAPDIADLWKDPSVRTTLDDFFRIRLESEAGL